MFDDQKTWDLLMSKLTEMTSKYLSAQIEAGADAVQLFDSWIGVLDAVDYEEYVEPFVREIFRYIAAEHGDTPKIHFGTNTAHLLRLMKHDGGNVVSIDWRIPISQARQLLDDSMAIQGNLDPAVLLAVSKDFIGRRTQQVLDENGASSGHVFNLGHGILRDTPVENAKFVVDYVHNHTSRN
jgi:uroporphyrinogen decarboxylase